MKSMTIFLLLSLFIYINIPITNDISHQKGGLKNGLMAKLCWNKKSFLFFILTNSIIVLSRLIESWPKLK